MARRAGEEKQKAIPAIPSALVCERFVLLLSHKTGRDYSARNCVFCLKQDTERAALETLTKTLNKLLDQLDKTEKQLDTTGNFQ